MTAHAETSVLRGVSPRRRRTDVIMRGVVAAGTVIALVPLVLIVYYLLKQGLGALSWDFFTTDPTGRILGDPGGVKSAIIGTIPALRWRALRRRVRRKGDRQKPKPQHQSGHRAQRSRQPE